MKKQKTVADRLRTMLEAEILELTEKRRIIDEELKVLVKMVGVVETPRKKRFVKRPTSEVAIELLKKHDEVTPAMLAEEARVSGAAASQCLTVLVENKKVKKVKRGVFSR